MRVLFGRHGAILRQVMAVVMPKMVMLQSRKCYFCSLAGVAVYGIAAVPRKYSYACVVPIALSASYTNYFLRKACFGLRLESLQAASASAEL